MRKFKCVYCRRMYEIEEEQSVRDEELEREERACKDCSVILMKIARHLEKMSND